MNKNKLSFNKILIFIFIFVVIGVIFFVYNNGLGGGLGVNNEMQQIKGLTIDILEEGEGDEISPILGDRVTINMVVFLESGKEISRQDNFIFTVGDGTVLDIISEEGISNMKIGEIRRLNLEPEHGFGENGIPGLIPPNSTVIFEIELVNIESKIMN